jgi:hypothetical protein
VRRWRPGHGDDPGARLLKLTVADEELAAVERDVEVDAEVLAGDLGGGLEAETRAAPRVGAGAEELDVELDRTGDALDGQVAHGRGAVEGSRGEGHAAVVLHVEEVGGAQVAVARLVTRVDRVQVDRRGGAGLFQRGAGGQGTIELGELAAHLAHQVAHGEAHLGVAGVDGPGASNDVGAEVSGGRHANQSSGSGSMRLSRTG